MWALGDRSRRHFFFAVGYFAITAKAQARRSYESKYKDGLVVDDEGNSIPQVTVLLSDLEGASVYETATDDAGKFMAPIRGKIVRALKSGFVYLPQVEVEAERSCGLDERVGVVRIILTRACAISGAVLDQSGMPVRSVKVCALKRRGAAADVRLVPQYPGALTDDRGYFRLYGLTPGTFTIAVLPTAAHASERCFAPIYFPNTTAPGRAEFFFLRPGESKGELQLLLSADLTTQVIAGRVDNIPAMWRRDQIGITIIRMDGGFPIETILTANGGHFASAPLPIGAYQLVAGGPVIGKTSSGLLLGRDSMQGFVEVSLGTGDLTDVVVSLRSGVEVGVRVVGMHDKSLTICLNGAAVTSSSQRRVQPDQNGVAIFHNVPVGKYHVTVDGSDGCFIRELTPSDNNRFLVVDQDCQVTAVVSSETGNVRGTVRLADGSPAPCALVVLRLPENRYDSTIANVRVTRADNSGQFSFFKIHAHEWMIIALKNINSDDFLDPVFWAAQSGCIISVNPNRAVDLDLQLSIRVWVRVDIA